MQPARLATSLLLAILGLQLALAAGLPLGEIAWGGQHPGVLPANLRWSSVGAALVLALCLAALHYRFRPGLWFFAGYFLLNTVLNLFSPSALERWTMTPLAALLSYCLFQIARSRTPTSIQSQ